MTTGSTSTPTVTLASTFDPASLVDAYAIACAEAAQAEARKKELAAQILETGFTRLQGTLHRCSVSTLPGRCTVDVPALVRDGLLTQQQVDDHTRRGMPYQTVRLHALT